ncbi:V-type ATP synthase subunit E [[Clostridium] polysaccharolyticum]|jgi:vacuolar-type H+-ATPase subunit E/Vma4|uniref:H+-ATPase subunit E/Vma4 n=1 Tax=[Clostridium] polysaccharolyticum TaxID=29364 RepID=A0A1I0D693_9FIRM|nr:V-type ATP synthase subunit E [[Clostridium] polysaccharolyticum]SET27783.1 H+-ATPase subunit E/Vma4 [[Clostridium] polysaccharolyticum]
MTLEEKLDIFYNAAINDATNQSIQILDEYKANLEKLQKEHEEETLKKAETTLKNETEYLVRDKNKRISDHSLILRRKITQKTNELEKSVFERVLQKLQDFMATPAYLDLIKEQIQYALNYANGEAIELYLNESDSRLKSTLEDFFHCTILLSKIDFMGGTRAVIQSRNVLIDNSFATKITEERESFTIK